MTIFHSILIKNIVRFCCRPNIDIFPINCAQLFRVARQKLTAMCKKLENFPLNCKCYSENAGTFDLSPTSVVALFPFAMVKVEHLFVSLLKFKTYYLSVCQSIYTSACKLRTFRSPPKLLAMMTLMNLTSSCSCC